MEKLDKELTQWLWMLAGAAAVISAGIVKVTIADKLNDAQK